MKGGCRGIHQGRHPAAPEPFGIQDLDRNTGEDFLPLGAATREPQFPPSDVGLVNLYPSTEALPIRANQDRAETMKHGPHRLVGSELQGPLQAQRRDAVFPSRKMPAGREPDCEGGAGPIEDGACHHGGALSASRALISAVAKPPSSRESTGRADKAARPSQPFQVVQAIGIGLEPRLEVSKGFGVVGAGTRTFHGGILRPTPVKWTAQSPVYRHRATFRLYRPRCVCHRGCRTGKWLPKPTDVAAASHVADCT